LSFRLQADWLFSACWYIGANMRIGEQELIQQVRRAAGAGASVVKGIGDDCAVLRVPSGHEVLVTTDFSIEKVHFRREWHPPELVGWRCLTRGLSDIAAMGGEPLAVFLSLAVADNVAQKWVDRFLKGLLELAKESGISLAGGDTAQSAGGIQADIVVVGSVPRGKAVLRSGAKAGDAIFVTGELGGAAAELGVLRKSKGVENLRRAFSRNLRRDSGYARPHARVAVGRWLRERGVASAMIDLSDGLSTDLGHICEESRVGAEIEAAAIPLASLGKEVVGLELALHGGDDYELLFTSRVEVPAEIAGVRVTCIGRVGRFAGMRLVVDGKARRLRAGGWEHFRGR
jgi:thiamine-monophosphate kinase